MVKPKINTTPKAQSNDHNSSQLLDEIKSDEQWVRDHRELRRTNPELCKQMFIARMMEQVNKKKMEASTSNSKSS